jgi:tetratricopeptide (TPR) repeat protein
MYQRDYILRLIEQFGQFVGAVLQLARDGRLREAREMVDQSLLGSIGTDVHGAARMSPQALIAAARFGVRDYASPQLGLRHLSLLGLLLRDAAEVLDMQAEPDIALALRYRALEVYLAVLAEDAAADSDAGAALGPIVASLRDYELPEPTRQRLWRTFAALGQFAQAEDWLFDLLNDDPSDRVATVDDAVGVFEAALQEDDAALEAGGLSRAEVEGVLADLRAART